MVIGHLQKQSIFHFDTQPYTYLYYNKLGFILMSLNRIILIRLYHKTLPYYTLCILLIDKLFIFPTNAVFMVDLYTEK